MERRSHAGRNQLLSPKLGTDGAAERRTPKIDVESTDAEVECAVNFERLCAKVDDAFLTLDNDFDDLSVIIDELKIMGAERARLLERAATHIEVQLTHVNKHEEKSGETEGTSENQELDVMCWLSLECVYKDLQTLCDEFVQ